MQGPLGEGLASFDEGVVVDGEARGLGVASLGLETILGLGVVLLEGASLGLGVETLEGILLGLGTTLLEGVL